MTRSASKVRAIELFEMVAVAEAERRLAQFLHELSGGLRHRVMIAVTLAGEPDALSAGERTTALDVTVKKHIFDLLADLQAQLAMSIILITHDLGFARGGADHLMVLSCGRAMERASAEALFSHMDHPYTPALFASTPLVDQPQHTRLLSIAGSPPDPVDPPFGCRFSPRCPYLHQRCSTAMPEVQHWSPHQYGCFFPVVIVGSEDDEDCGWHHDRCSPRSGTEASFGAARNSGQRCGRAAMVRP